MMFNPLFIQNNIPNSAIENSKLTKLSNPSYLFSDIIRLLNDSSTNKKVIVSSETLPEQAKSNQIFSLVNKSPVKGNESKTLDQSGFINTIEEPVNESGKVITGENINVSGSLNLIPSKIDLTASLNKIFRGIPGNGIDLKDAEALNNLTAISTTENEKENNQIKVGDNLINTLENNGTPALNFNLLSSAALNFNDKQQLLIKVFNSESGQNKLSKKLVTLGKDSLDKELKKIASLLFGLLTQQNSLPTGKIQKNTFDPATVKTVSGQNIYPLDPNAKNTILSHLNSNEPLILNITLGGENLKIEITSELGEMTNNKVQTPGALLDTEISQSSDKLKGQEVKNSTENNILKDVITGANKKTLRKSNIENPTTANDVLLSTELSQNSDKLNSKEVKNPAESNSLKDAAPGANERTLKKNNIENLTAAKLGEINPELKTEQLNVESAKKFTLKITHDTANGYSQSINTLKKMLQNMGVNEKIEIKVLTPKNKSILKTETQQIGKMLSKDKNVIVKNNNGLPNSNQTSQNIINQNTSKVNGLINTDNNVPGNLVETIDNFTQKSSGSKKRIGNTDMNSNKAISNIQDRQVVAGITETPDKDTEQKSSSDKKEIFDLRSVGNQTNTSNIGVIKNETTQNIFKMFGENNVTVKASNLLNEISRLFEKGESKSVVLKLKPDTLGQVKILLDVVDKFVNVNIQVNNESVKQMVQNNINTLVQTLNLSGLHLSSLNVSINNYENKENKSDSEKKKSSTSRFQQKTSEDVNTINTKSMGYNTYDFLI